MGAGLASCLASAQPAFTEYPTNLYPQAITTGPDGALWFAGYGVGKITTAGVVTQILPAPTVAASGIVTGPDGALWFTDDASNSIGHLSTTGTLVDFLIPTGNSHPGRIAVGPDGALWFTETQANKIGRVTTAGNITEYTVPTANSAPTGITLGPDGALWFTETSGNNIGRITAAGAIVEYPTPTPSEPLDITVGPDGALWYTASAVQSSSIGRITTTGAFTVYPVSPAYAQQGGITAGSDGALWFTADDGLAIARISTSGTLTEYQIPQPGSGAYGITTGPDGALWFAEFFAGIGKAVTTGVAVPTISAASLPPGGIGLSYSTWLYAIGGTPPYNNWTASGLLPPGLTLSSSTGGISGVPTAVGTYSFNVTVQDTTGTTSAAQSFSITITQAPPCSYALSAGGQIFSATGGSGSVAVTAGTGCPWTVSGIPAWVTITSGTTGAGNGSVNFTVPPNTGVSALSASFTIAGSSFTIQEAGSLPDLIPGIPQVLSFIGSMPHLAAEGGWNTTFTFMNKNVGPVVAGLSLFAPDGTPLAVPVNLPQTAAPPEPFETASLEQTIASDALFVLQATGPTNVPYVEGSAQLTATVPTNSVDGFAIFHYDPTSQEAAVPLETRNAASYLLAFDNTGGVVTGVAVENVSAQSATIPVILRDSTGAQIGTGSVALFGSGHTSFVLSTQFPVTANIRGTMELDTPAGGQISALGIRYTPPGTLTTIPTLANVGKAGGAIAHLAVGNGWETTFVLVNTGTSAAQANLNFYADNGNPLPLNLTFPQNQISPITAASTLSQSIAPGASLWVQSSGLLGAALLTGSAQLTTTGNVGGFVIYRYNPNGQEAVVPLESRGAGTYFIAYDNTSGTSTGIAISNASTASINVPVTLRNDAGSTVGTGSITLNANGHTSFGLASQFPQTANLRGTVEFDAPSGSVISVVGIRSPTALTFTTLPALAQ